MCTAEASADLNPTRCLWGIHAEHGCMLFIMDPHVERVNKEVILDPCGVR